MLLDGLRRLLRLGKSLTLTPNNPQCPYHFNLPPIPPVPPHIFNYELRQLHD